MRNSKLYLLLFVGLIIRLLLVNIPGFKYDVDSFFAWSLRLADLGLSNFYSPDVFTDYTPGYLYILNLLGHLKNIFSLSPESFYILIKMPAIICDLILGYLVFTETKKHYPKWAFLALAAVIFNPVFIFNSAVWGQVDSVLTLFMFLSIYFLSKGKLILTSIFYAIAILIKPQAIAISPVFLIYLIRNWSFKNLQKLIIPGIITITLLSFPFFPQNPWGGLINRILETAGQYPYNSLFAYNFWGMFGFWINDQTIFYGLPMQTWGFILFGLFWIIIFLLLWKKGNKSIFSNYYLLAAIGCLAFFFLPTKVHERYLYPGLIFLIIAIPYIRDRRFTSLVIALNLLHFLDLYYVYQFYNNFTLNVSTALYIEDLYKFLDTKGVLLSFLSTVTFIYLCFLLINHHERKTT